MKEALLELMEQKELANISVTALCDSADVHRSTFYKYYTDTSDLLKEIEMDFLNQIPTPSQIPDIDSQEQLLIETTAFFDLVKQNEKAFRILFSDSAGNSFTTRIVEVLCNGYMPLMPSIDEQSAHYIRIYIANGTVGMLREWVMTGCQISSRAIAEKMYFLSRKISLS